MTENNDRDTPRIFVPKGYVVFDLEITDPEGYEAYRLDGQATTRAFGGRVLSGEPAPRGIVEQLEGDWPTKRFVINEFPTVEIARAWFHSDTYAVTRAHFLDRASLALDQADPLGDEDRLAAGWVCHAVRAPGAKCTIPPMIREVGDGMLTTSM